MFGAFSLFWTCVSLELTGPRFQLSQTGVAIFALVGVAGAIASPIAGRRADQGKSHSTTAAALLLGVAAFALPLLVHGSRLLELAALVIASIVLDMGVSANLVTGQRALFALAAETRSRLNGLYIAIFFSVVQCSSLGAWMFAQHGWQGCCGPAGLPLTAFLIWLAAARD
jgi:predicted MFS family arabinose efflux permease